jgi:hypothetical protein
VLTNSATKWDNKKIDYLVKGKSSNFRYTSTECKVNNFLAKTIYFKDLSSTVTIQKIRHIKPLNDYFTMMAQLLYNVEWQRWTNLESNDMPIFESILSRPDFTA